MTTVIQMGCASAMKDEHQWLENVDGKEAMEWVNSTNEVSKKHFVKNPDQKKYEDEAFKILDNKSRIPSIRFHGQYVYNFWTDQKNPRGVFRRTTFENYKSTTPEWEILIDIDELNKKENKSWVYQGCDFHTPESSRCLLRLSDAGRDAAETREFDVGTKQFVKDGFFIPISKGGGNWIDQDTLLVSTNLPGEPVSASGYALQVRLWKRGTDLANAEIIYKAEDSDNSVYNYTISGPDGSHVIIHRSINFYESESFYFKNSKNLEKLPYSKDVYIYGFWKNEIYITNRKDLVVDGKKFVAGSLLKAPVGDWQNLEAVFTPTDKVFFEGVSFTKNEMYLSVIDNVVPKVLLNGKPAPVHEIGNTYLVAINKYGSEVVLQFDSPLTPPTYYQWEKNQVTEIKKMPAQFDSSNLKVEQLFATSKDGTQIPYFLIRSKFSKGPAPTIINAYGGFEISMVPFYDSIDGKLWLEKGGQYVIANIRGGGEFGPIWHAAALKEKRQNAYDDLFAVTEDLFKKTLTTSDRVGLIGGSNGGLLAGVALTQRPDLYKAIVCEVPLLDMKRYHLLPAGHSWMAEYGNPDDPKDWEYISKYSPYQNLKKGVKYPAFFITTSTRDDRVHPGHARKMAARMKQMEIPFYYHENIEGGHGRAADLKQQAYRLSLQYTFFHEHLK